MRKPLAISVLALSSACQLAPPHVPPELPTARAYSDEYVRDALAGTRATTLGWRDFFLDPRLEALISAALNRNRDLAVAVAQIEEARGLFRVQRSENLPTISASSDATRVRSGAAGVGAGRFPDVIAGGDERVSDIYSLALATSAFELDFWGRVRNLTAAARSEYLATREAARAFRLSLIRDVALAYLTSLEATERIQLAEATVRSRQDELRLAKRRLDAGVVSELEFRQAETLLHQAEIELATLRLTRAQNDNFLSTLVGGPIDEDRLPEGLPLERQVNVDTLAAGVPSELLVSRPDVLAAEERLRAARANIGAARAAFLPSISLTGSYGYASRDLDELVGGDNKTWSFGRTIGLTLFDFGSRFGNLTVAQARENITLATYERTVQTAFQEVSDALAGRRYLAEQVAAQERATIAQRRLAELARKRYLEGVVSYLEVLDAERNLFSSEQALLQARRAEVANIVTLYVALGGGVLEGR